MMAVRVLLLCGAVMTTRRRRGRGPVCVQCEADPRRGRTGNFATDHPRQPQHHLVSLRRAAVGRLNNFF